MKRILYHIAALCSALLALSGCIKDEWTFGSSIRFGSATLAENLTKTSYGAIVNGSPKKQMVDWVENDTLRIVCAQASTTEAGTSTSADYKTSAGTRYNSSAESRATLSLLNGNAKGLRWGSTSEDHVFYAVYPSPLTRTGDALTTAGALTGNIPAVQVPDSVNNASPYTALPDMKNQYMVAKRTVAAGKQKIEDGEVLLYFTPITTAIQFGIKNKMSDALAIQSIEISSASKNLSGTFTTSLTGLNENGGTYPTVTAGAGATKAASVSFGSTGLSLAVDDSLTFTIFLLPESDLDDLTFKIYKVGGGTIKTALKYDESTWIPFGRCKKHFINGLFVNEGAIWTLCFNPEVFPWDHKSENKDLVDPSASGAPKLIFWSAGEEKNIYLNKPDNYQFSLETGVPSTQSFTNPESGREKTFDIRSTKNTTISQDWKIKSVGGVNVSGTSFTTADGDLKVEKDSDGNLKVTDLRQKVSNGDNKHWTDGSAGNAWFSQSWGSEEGGLDKGTIDLSKYDFKSDTPNAHSMRTANCYIIRHAGTYKIPLVYGNAIDYDKDGLTNGVNTDAYKPTIASGGANDLTPFVNHLGLGIKNPFIENNTEDGNDKYYTAASGKPGTGNYKPAVFNKFLEASSATVLWQDKGEVIKSVELGTAVSGHDNETGSPVMCDANHVRYIQFSISKYDIRQCNAVIAVKDASGNIMWSWHIWITNNPLMSSDAISVTYNSNSYGFMPAPCLGWIEPDLYEAKNDVDIVLEQVESGETVTVTVKQPLYDNFKSYGTYYQWGRKDPFRPGASGTATGQKTVQGGILDPGSFAVFNGNWCSTVYNNLWTGKYSGTDNTHYGNDMIKTIYDPSPVGYKVPAQTAFNCIGSSITFVPNGYLNRSSGSQEGTSGTLYWSSVSYTANGYSYNTNKSGLANDYKAQGFAIRPVTE